MSLINKINDELLIIHTNTNRKKIQKESAEKKWNEKIQIIKKNSLNLLSTKHYNLNKGILIYNITKIDVLFKHYYR